MRLVEELSSVAATQSEQKVLLYPQFAAAGILGQDVAVQARSLHTSLTTCQGAPAEAKSTAL